MAKVYISSTYVDLKKEREAAAQAVRRLGHHAIAMEDYVAIEDSKAWLCNCLCAVQGSQGPSDSGWGSCLARALMLTKGGIRPVKPAILFIKGGGK
jgi:hypothetical protein